MHFETGDDADGAETGDAVGHTEQVLAGAPVGGEEVGDTARTTFGQALVVRIAADAVGVPDNLDCYQVGACQSRRDIRQQAFRLARQLAEVEAIDVAAKLVSDKSAQVRRECAIALRHTKTDQAAKLWAELASRHDGEDRWYLEALGLSSDLNAEACFSAWLAKVGDTVQFLFES